MTMHVRQTWIRERHQVRIAQSNVTYNMIVFSTQMSLFAYAYFGAHATFMSAASVTALPEYLARSHQVSCAWF